MQHATTRTSRRRFLTTVGHLTGTALMLEAAPLAGAAPAAVLAKSTRQFAYVGSRTTKERKAEGDGITVYEIDRKSGVWRHVQTLGDLVNPSYLVLDRRSEHLYAVHGDRSEVSAFRVDRDSGQLAFLNQQSTGGKNPVHLAIDPSEKYLLIANYATGTVATLPIRGNGALDPLTALAVLPGEPGPHKTQQGSSHPHQVCFDPSGKFIAVPDKGLDRVFTFELDDKTGKLAPTIQGSVQGREGAGTRHLAFHPALAMGYVANELDSRVTAYQYDATSGQLKPSQILPTLPSTYTGNSTAAAIAMSRSGKLLFVSNRGGDSIAIFRINPRDGLLTSVGHQSSQGKGPRFMRFDPYGEILYVANENSHTIVGLRLDEANERFLPTGQVIKTGSPVCIVFAEL